MEKRRQRGGRWLETEWIGRQCVNQGDLLATETEFMEQEPKSRASRSQSAHSSEEAS